MNAFPQELSDRIAILQRINELADLATLKMLLEIAINKSTYEKPKNTVL